MLEAIREFSPNRPHSPYPNTLIELSADTVKEMPPNAYEELFSKHRSAAVPSLWPWQTEVLQQYTAIDGDAAVELPTGAGKTLIGLLAGEQLRLEENRPVAYLTGNKQLAQQVERHARELAFPVVRFQGRKDSWDAGDVRSYNYGQAIGVMNYWNYFNASPGVDPAGMLILDDVHLLEGPLRDMFTVSISSREPLYKEILRRIVESYPYYVHAEDLLNDVEPLRPPEMLVFPDSADLANEVRDLFDASLEDGSDPWWAWQQIREHLEVCCWLASSRSLNFTPYIPPSQTLEHFSQPSRRLYLSATVGSVDDLRRRLGAPTLTKLTSSVQPRQGERLVVVRDGTEMLDSTDLINELRELLEAQKKALWLCARKETAENLAFALRTAELDGEVRMLQGDNAEDEPFAADEEGHLVTAGRYDGMDFPEDACRVEVMPEVPVATNDLEEFISAYLRDAPFAEARFAQRVAQALGRCNRTEEDRAVYLLTDPEFLGRFNQRRVLDALPDHVRHDVFAALTSSERGFTSGLGDAGRFLNGETPEQPNPPARRDASEVPPTASAEVDGFLALWAEDYGLAAELFDRVARELGGSREYRAFWLAMRSLALKRAADFGDRAAGRQAMAALEAAATAGGRNTFFTRLRLSRARLQNSSQALEVDGDDDLFAAWDRLLDRYGSTGPRFDRWVEAFLADLRSSNHDAIARRVAEVGTDLLGLNADAPKPTGGEEDAFWEMQGPRRVLTFEVKLAPDSERIVNDDIEQAEGATTAAEKERGFKARGVLLTPHQEIDDTAVARLDHVRLLRLEEFASQVETLLSALREYRRGWGRDAADRGQAREKATPQLPPVDWLWSAVEQSEVWIEADAVQDAWDRHA